MMKPEEQQLIMAAYSGDADLVTELLKKDVNPNVRDKNGITALSWASSAGRFKVVEVLLQYGADDTLPDNRGRTALQSATLNGHQTVAQLLRTPPPPLSSYQSADRQNKKHK